MGATVTEPTLSILLDGDDFATLTFRCDHGVTTAEVTGDTPVGAGTAEAVDLIVADHHQLHGCTCWPDKVFMDGGPDKQVH